MTASYQTADCFIFVKYAIHTYSRSTCMQKPAMDIMITRLLNLTRTIPAERLFSLPKIVLTDIKMWILVPSMPQISFK